MEVLGARAAQEAASSWGRARPEDPAAVVICAQASRAAPINIAKFREVWARV